MSKEKKLLRRIQDMVKRAMTILRLSKNISIILEPIGNRFKTLENAAEMSGSTLYVNSDWLKIQEEQNRESEIRLLIYHEIRHVYQLSEIFKWENKQETKEDLLTILRWNKEFKQYQRNMGGVSTILYYQQSVEIDAYAFGMYLLNLDVQRGDRLNLETRSIPDEVYQAIINRLQELANK